MNSQVPVPMAHLPQNPAKHNFIYILSPCTYWNSDIHLFTDMMEEAWMSDSRLRGEPISKTVI